MKKKLIYIVNPVSGTKNALPISERLLGLTDKEKYDAEIQFTEFAGHGELLARQAAALGTDIVVAVGGDGTVNEVGRGVVGSATALGVIPCGSGNGLARHLHIPLNVNGAVDVLNKGVVHELDYGEINGHAFFCTCGVGFDAFISERFSHSHRRGMVTYIENVLKTGLSFRPSEYVIEDETGKERTQAFLIAAANASQYGNDALIAPTASMRDGLLDVVLIKPFNLLEAGRVAVQLFTGELSANEAVHTFRTDHLRIKREGGGVVHADGEPFRTGTVIDIRLHHGLLRAVVNDEKKERRIPGSVAALIPKFFSEWRGMSEDWVRRRMEKIGIQREH